MAIQVEPRNEASISDDTAELDAFSNALREALNLPLAIRAALAQHIIASLDDNEPEDLDAIVKRKQERPHVGPPPTDEEVEQWLDEYRMEKYG